ncbi:MAG: type IX secretion system membrane protein PorP/SprF [Flavobacteriales bacterium]
MKTLRYILIAAITMMSISNNSKAQNQFLVSQYMLHHGFINPAAIANTNRMSGAAFYRTTWTGFDGAPVLQGINFNTPFSGGNNAAGITILHDKIGVNRNIEITGTYAYRMKVGMNQYLSFGAAATVSLLQSDFSSVNTTQPNDPIFSASTPTFAMPNFKFGAYYFQPNFYVGLSVPNLLENKIVYATEYQGKTSFNFSAIHFYLNAGYKWAVNRDFDMNFSTMVKNVSGAPLQMDLNAMGLFNKKFGIGLSFRTSKELVGLLNFQLNQSWRLGYGYDFNFNRIGNYSNGSHEIMVVFNMAQVKSHAILESPRF